MTDFQVAAILLTLTAALAYLNARLFKLPSAIGLMAISLVGSIAVIGIDAAGVSAVAPRIADLLDALQFDEALLHGMLGLLLFAGALHVDLGDLAEQKWEITALAIVGTVLSTALVGGTTYVALDLLGMPLPFIFCLVFGALISPTDPIAVLGILKSAGAPPRLRVMITGESLFNDGVGVVVFLVLVGVATGGDVSAVEVTTLFVQEAAGGVVFGLLIGFAGYRLLRTIDQYSVEVLITLAMTFGGYAAAEALHLSAPITAVVSGLLIGNQGRRLAMSATTREHLDTFWELIDEILNAVLFLVIGLEVVHLHVSSDLAVAAAVIVPVVLIIRFVAVSTPLMAMPKFRRSAPGTLRVLTWGGLRGGISVALALSLPAGPEREVILVITYAVVVFSVLVQGLTLGRVIRAVVPRSD
jgi:monovalent cation:H+ antiporter, CPA1 family